MLLSKNDSNTVLFSVLLIALLINPSISFSLKKISVVSELKSNSVLEERLYSLPHLKSTSTVEETEVEPKLGITSLCFHAERDFTSEPVPPLPSCLSIDDFIRDNEMVVLRGSNNEVEEVSNEIRQKYFSTWVERCKLARYSEPCDNDIIYQVIKSGTKFPGLEIKSFMHMGCKLITSSESKSDYPELQFVLLDSKNVPEGSKFMVWIYNKLTGENQNEDEGEGEKGTYTSDALMRLTLSCNDNDELIFHSSSMLNIYIEFPSVFVKLMPVSKCRAESLGSDAIGNALDIEGQHTLNSLEKVYNSLIVKE